MYTSVKFLVAIWASLALAEFPPEFQRCDRNAADFQQCLTQAVEDAIKQLKVPKAGLPGLEPLVIETIGVEAAKEDAKYTGKLSNYQLHGLADSNFTINTNMDFAKNTFVLEITYPKLEHYSACEFDGTIKGQSITGKGSGGCVGEKEKFSLTFLLEEYTKDGKSYYKINGNELVIVGEGASCYFDKFDGDISAEDLTKLVNDNILLYVGEITDEFQIALGAIFQSYFEKILDNASIDEIFGKASSDTT